MYVDQNLKYRRKSAEQKPGLSYAVDVIIRYLTSKTHKVCIEFCIKKFFNNLKCFKIFILLSILGNSSI